MKCSKCGHKSTTIGAMAKHYRSAHPGAMKAKKPRKTRETQSDYSAAVDTAYNLIKIHEHEYHGRK